MEFISNSPLDTEKFAIDFSKTLTGGEVIAFRGGMGMGKTHFTRALAKGLGFSGAVNSPTFAIVNEYRGGRLPLFHFDMFRIESWEDLDSCGFFDYMEEKGVIAVEWSENIESALDDGTIYITLEKLSENSRKITIEGGGYQ
ncbi:MAG: tRNA (adenosine(37)-N6)-threonylcarbamoyltransferase complex ATPase subunit type 1 TsaE [Acutalibacteraceae bacterium]|nr:tRNA (adenosine(37)-N6)-threonylcarbamoyltransferase complex ATPase subunit type 1 TsaE [Acutalibacteraceae bacterium]